MCPCLQYNTVSEFAGKLIVGQRYKERRESCLCHCTDQGHTGRSDDIGCRSGAERTLGWGRAVRGDQMKSSSGNCNRAQVRVSRSKIQSSEKKCIFNWNTSESSVQWFLNDSVGTQTSFCSLQFFLTSQRCPLSVPFIDSLRSDAAAARRQGHLSMWQEALCVKSEQLVIRVGQPFIPLQQYPHGQNNEAKSDALLLQMCWDLNLDLNGMLSTSFGLEASISAQTLKHLIPAALSFYTIIGNSSCCHSAPSGCWRGAF